MVFGFSKILVDVWIQIRKKKIAHKNSLKKILFFSLNKGVVGT